MNLRKMESIKPSAAEQVFLQELIEWHVYPSADNLERLVRHQFALVDAGRPLIRDLRDSLTEVLLNG